MIVEILGDKDSPAYIASEALVKRLGHAIYDCSYYYKDIAIAPLLTNKVSMSALQEPLLGTLIFHPSPLPYGRGASSIRWAFRRREPVTAATWFWATDQLDAGDICEMEIIKLDTSISPREFYSEHILPAMARTLQRCLNDLSKGIIRKAPQVEAYATYDVRIV